MYDTHCGGRVEGFETAMRGRLQRFVLKQLAESPHQAPSQSAESPHQVARPAMLWLGRQGHSSPSRPTRWRVRPCCG